MIAYQQLVDELRTLLQLLDQQNVEQIRRLAGLYNTACQQANVRLRRCADLLAKGLRSEAIHLAQTEPVLLDEVAALDFPERKQWEQLCVNHMVPMPPPLDLDTATMLNEAYADDQPVEELLRKHRLLALGRAPLAVRLGLLRRLAELEPRNQAWEEDVRNFERARIQQLHNDLEQWVQRQNAGAIMAAANEIKNARWRIQPPATLVTKVQNAAKHFEGQRGLAILKDIEIKLNDAMTAFDVPRALALRDQWNRVIAACRPPQNDPIWGRMGVVLDWVQQQATRQTDEAAYQAAVAALDGALGQAKPLADLEAAHGRAVQFGRGLPEPVEARYQAAARGIRSRAKRRQLLLIAGPALAIALLVAGGIWYSSHTANADKVQTTIAAVDQLLVNHQVAEAEAYFAKLEQADPDLVQKRPIQDLKLRLQAASKEEQDRLVHYKDALREAEDAPLNATGQQAVDRLEKLARLPEEKAAVGKLVRNRKAQLEETRLAQEKALQPRVAELAREVERLEESLKKSYDAAAVARIVNERRQALTALRGDPGASSPQVQETVNGLAERLDAARDQIQRANAEVFRLEEITAALNGRDVVEPFARAAEKYVAQFADTQRGKDVKRALLERDAWDAVVAWRRLIEPLAAKPLDVSFKDAPKWTEQLGQFAKDHPRSPDAKLIDNYGKALEGNAQRNAGDPKSAVADLRKIFTGTVVREVWMVRTDDGKTYYSTENLQQKIKTATGGAVTIDYLVGYDGKTKRTLRRIATITKVGVAPQSAVADDLRYLGESVADKEWETTIMKFAQKIRDSRDMDPVLQMILLRQVLECGARGSYPFALAAAGHLQEFEKSGIDITVPWLDPDNEAAKKQRIFAREFLGQLPTFDRLLKQVTDEKQKLATAISASRYSVAGWLHRDKTGVWQVSSLSPLPDGHDLYVVVPAADETTSWQLIGRSQKGKTTLAGKPAAMVEGRLVFATANPTK